MTRDELLTSVVGSHAHPGWFVSGIAAAARGEFGPVDLAEMLDDAVDLAIRDQEAAGIDVITDGEMRRAGFFTAEFYSHLTGLRPLPSDRRLGAGGHDQQHRFEVLEPIAAPNGLGVIAEFVAARDRTMRPLKVTLPGPYTLSGRLRTGPGEVYPTRVAAAGGVRRDPPGGAARPGRRRGHDHPGRRTVTGDSIPTRPPTSSLCSTRLSNRFAAGCASVPICVSGTSWVGRWRPAPIARSATRCSASRSTSSSSNSPTARWPRSTCSPSWSMPAGMSRRA